MHGGLVLERFDGAQWQTLQGCVDNPDDSVLNFGSLHVDSAGYAYLLFYHDPDYTSKLAFNL